MLGGLPGRLLLVDDFQRVAEAAVLGSGGLLIEGASGLRREATERLLLVATVENLGTDNGWILFVGVLHAQYLPLILIDVSWIRAGAYLCNVLLCSLVVQLALPKHFFIVRGAVSGRSLHFAACVRIGLGLQVVYKVVILQLLLLLARDGLLPTGFQLTQLDVLEEALWQLPADGLISLYHGVYV